MARVPSALVKGTLTAMPRGKRCQAHHHEHMVSEEHHHIRPLSRGGPDTPTNLVWLCANAHSDVHAYLNLLEKGHGHVPWIHAKHFGSTIRFYAHKGWNAYADEFLLGAWTRHAHLWDSSGAGRTPSIPPYRHAAATRQVNRWLLHASDTLKG